MARINRSNHFSPEQDQIIVGAVQSGGFNNLQNTFRNLSRLRIFEGYSPQKIRNRYNWTLRKNYLMFQIYSLVHPTLKARVNYKNDPQLWASNTTRNNNRNFE